MITVSQTYQDILDDGGQYEWQIINGASTFSKVNLISGKITRTCYEQLSIGNVISAQLELELRDVTVDTDSILQVQFRTTDGSTNSSWYTKGYFFIDTLEASPYSEITKITAFDALLKTETDFMPTGSYIPMTAHDVAVMIATDIGVPLEKNTNDLLVNNPFTLNNAPNVGVGGTTDREMLSYIGIIYGGNWVITYGTYLDADLNEVEGYVLTLNLPYVLPTNTATVGDAVVSFDASEIETVKRIKLWLDHDTYYLAPIGYTEEQWLALGGRCIEAKLPFYATQAIATDLLSKFNDISFYPYIAQEAYIDPKYEVCDGVSFKTSDIVTSIIASFTVTLNPLAPSDIEFQQEDKVNSLYPYISSVQRSTLYQVTQATEAAEAAQTAVGNANYKEQTIYISKASGTSSVSANTTWVTDTTGNQNTWTTTRPVYNSSYPVLFVATQRQSVAQSSGTTCTCTTPVKDQTTTVIDGGHITTGTIDASVVNVTNINADNIETGTLTGVTISGNTISGNTISGGTISGTTITGSTLTSATANGSVQIANGNINFFKNATTTGTPFSQIKHTVDSSQGDSIEWTNSGYTKLVNTGGGQWTADFIQFALNSNNPSLRFLIYNASDGSCVEVRNTDYAYLNGSQLRANRAGHGDNAAIRVAHGTANKEAGVFVKRTDTDRSIELLVGSGGINRGIYVADANMDGWLLYYDDTKVNITKPVAFSYPAATRANLNMVSNLLMSGVSTTDIQVSSDITEYSAFIIVGVPDTTAKSTCFIPKAALSTTSTRWQVADNSYYIAADLYTSGNTLRMKVAGTNHGTKTLDIYGLRGA